MDRKIERIRNRKRDNEISKAVLLHVRNNKKEYFTCIVLFIIGIIISIFFINNFNESQVNEIITYVKEFINNLKNINEINYILLFFKSMKINTILLLIIFISALIVVRKANYLFNYNWKRLFAWIYNCSIYSDNRKFKWYINCR